MKKLIVAATLLLTATISIGASNKDTHDLEIDKAPSTSDWRYFSSMGSEDLGSLWYANINTGKTLKDWSWQWRIGWMKRCSKAEIKECDDILREGLTDKAMVVRAEAAYNIGVRHEGSNNKNALKLLVKAYKELKNERNGKPLLIRYRILYSIDQIAGESGKDVAKKLARSHPATESYWDKIDKNRI
jgi:hypothetical protein